MEQKQSTGFLIVNVSTARGAIPLPGASVTVMFDEPENNSVFTVVTTDTAGKTDRIELPAPERALSESPGNSKPYATYTLQIDKAGYYTVTAAGVPVFAGVTSIQPVEMLPLAEYNADRVYPRTGLDFAEGTNPNL
ncbi:MAG: carboxypeptidase regulatory-like domain-containing protein [Ruminococcaceae bacterium]|nr:carboxypeptidase regulatory-like domain-containing protein [Oscillospiraceae bacterium]